MIETICYYLSDLIFACLGISSLYAFCQIKSIEDFFDSVLPTMVGVVVYFTLTRYFSLTKLFSFVMSLVICYVIAYIATQYFKNENLTKFRF